MTKEYINDKVAWEKDQLNKWCWSFTELSKSGNHKEIKNKLNELKDKTNLYLSYDMSKTWWERSEGTHTYRDFIKTLAYYVFKSYLYTYQENRVKVVNLLSPIVQDFLENTEKNKIYDFQKCFEYTILDNYEAVAKMSISQFEKISAHLIHKFTTSSSEKSEIILNFSKKMSKHLISNNNTELFQHLNTEKFKGIVSFYDMLNTIISVDNKDIDKKMWLSLIFSHSNFSAEVAAFKDNSCDNRFFDKFPQSVESNEFFLSEGIKPNSKDILRLFSGAFASFRMLMPEQGLVLNFWLDYLFDSGHRQTLKEIEKTLDIALKSKEISDRKKTSAQELLNHLHILKEKNLLNKTVSNISVGNDTLAVKHKI